MDLPEDTPQVPPAALVESLERSRADITAGRTVPLGSFLACIDEKIRRWEISRAEKMADVSKR